MAVAPRVLGEEPAPPRRLHDGRLDRLVVGLADWGGYGKVGHCPSDCGKTDATNTARIVATSLMGKSNPTIVNDSFAWRLALVYASGFTLILIAAVTLAFVSAPVLPLTDAYGLKGLALRGKSYGPVRLWG